MRGLKRVLFAIGLYWSVRMVTYIEPGMELWQLVLLQTPLILFGLLIASRFWPYTEDKHAKKE
jgi:hypothetical protein